MNSEIERHDEKIDMLFSKAAERRALIIMYGAPLVGVIFIFIPWFVGFCTLAKWIFF